MLRRRDAASNKIPTDAQWPGSWAAPKGKDGKLDHNKALTGDELREFVDRKLFPYLHGFKQKASGSNILPIRFYLPGNKSLPVVYGKV